MVRPHAACRRHALGQSRFRLGPGGERGKLAAPFSPDWLRTAAWLMREARVDQVWQFLSLRQIAEMFPQLQPLLGKRRTLWEYLLRTAHELGRI